MTARHLHDNRQQVHGGKSREFPTGPEKRAAGNITSGWLIDIYNRCDTVQGDIPNNMSRQNERAFTRRYHHRRRATV
jgi:hypothetical protein